MDMEWQAVIKFLCFLFNVFYIKLVSYYNDSRKKQIPGQGQRKNGEKKIAASQQNIVCYNLQRQQQQQQQIWMEHTKVSVLSWKGISSNSGDSDPTEEKVSKLLYLLKH